MTYKVSLNNYHAWCSCRPETGCPDCLLGSPDCGLFRLTTVGAVSDVLAETVPAVPAASDPADVPAPVPALAPDGAAAGENAGAAAVNESDHPQMHTSTGS